MFGNIKNIIRNIHISWLHFKVKNLSDFRIKAKTLIIAPHPDDEVIGCGGLISRMVEEKNPPFIVILTGGGRSHKGCCNITEEEIIKNRRKLTKNALSILGVPADHIFQLDFLDGSIPSNKKDTDPTQYLLLTTLLHQISPDVIFVPHWGEGWPDHISVKPLVKEILESLKEDYGEYRGVQGSTGGEASGLKDEKLGKGGVYNIQKVQLFEYCVWMPFYNVWRGLDWKNAFKLEMTPEEHKKKLEAMEAYVKPLAPCGKPWSGVLPKLFLKANLGNTELYFKVE